MKKNPKAPFTVAEAVQRANAMYAQSAAMLPGATFEEQSEATLRHHMAWVQISDVMTRLAAQPEVELNPVAVEFLQVIVAQVNARGFGARSAQDVLLPLDTLLPMGEAHIPFADNSGRGEGPVKALVREVLPKLERKLKRNATHLEVWHACAVQRGTNIKFVASPTWGEPEKAVPARGKPAKWTRFKVIISEVRKTPKP